jgi:uncharacterized protein (TIGR02757 family)
MVASALAYGRVQQILKSVSEVMERMGDAPSNFVLGHSAGKLQNVFADFRHRFTGGAQLAALLTGMKRLILRYGSLQACFCTKSKRSDDTILPALAAFVQELSKEASAELNMLLPSPRKGSACKRLNLFLRWMVRTDDVDPGGWKGVSPGKLVVPLDTHMHRIGLKAGLTCRKQADLRAAIEVTRGFRIITPEDPVRYDFALTRLGIHDISEGSLEIID